MKKPHEKFFPPIQGGSVHLDWNALPPNIVYVTNLFDYKPSPILIIYLLHKTST